ncbi:MAG: AAA family ATPase, partial [Halioglobus sp.]|nr:AAA family ATPase [Halioglobus sp.]
VQMRRFDESQLLDNIAARGDLSRPLLRSIARELARLHGALPRCYPDPGGNEAGTPAVLRAALEENFAQIRNYSLEAPERRHLEKIAEWTRGEYDRLLPVMQQRIRDGWVIDGHGDDHLGNMTVIDGAVRLFDCIEFNAGFRVIDSIAEIALLDMDLNARDHPAECYRLLTYYQEYRGDFDGLALLDLYAAYYALVRAKVNLLQHPPDHPDLAHTQAYGESRRYLDMAHRYCTPRRRFIAITHGLSGSGKSTVAGNLVEASGAVRIRSDVERKRLFGLQPEQSSMPADKAKLYSGEMTRRTFERLQVLAAAVLDAGFAVIVDATFLQRRARDEFRTLAQRLDVPFVILGCTASEEELQRRLLLRQQSGPDASEADVEVMERQRATVEAPADDELDSLLEVHPGWDAGRLWRDFARRLEAG